MLKPHLNNTTLREIRKNTDWRKLFDVLNLRKDDRKSTVDDWWALSPFNEEKLASFHINDNGFHCFSTKESGGPIELVQAYFRHRTGEILNCYDAGRWLVEHGASFLPEEELGPKNGRSEGKKETVKELQEKIDNIKPAENKPIKQDLRYAMVYDHPEFEKRGISEKTLKYLGAGFLPAEKTKTEGLKDRLVFQVRGIQRTEEGSLDDVILCHIGRASTSQQAEGVHGKWWIYPGFRKSIELYNIDNLLLDPEAVEQTNQSKRVLVVEGAFDVAKLVEAGILNCVSTFGSHLYKEQLERLKIIHKELGENIEFLVFYDRDKAGREGSTQAVKLIEDSGLSGQAFDWDVTFSSEAREVIKIPEKVKDVCDFSVEQFVFLKKNGVI